MIEKTIFKKIIDGEMFAYKIYEDNNFLVFLDVFPKSPGHTLIIPKKEYRWVWDVDMYDDFFDLARRVAIAQKKVFNVDMIYLGVEGDEVPHAHIHVRTTLLNDGSEKNFEGLAKKIKKAL